MRTLTRHWPWAALGLGILANGVRLRARISHFAVLDESTTLRLVDSRRHPAEADILGEFRLLTAEGVVVEDATVEAAVRHARAEDLDVLDLIPGDLHVERLYELARHVDPAKFRGDRLAGGRGACHATLVRSGLADELGLGHADRLDPVTYVETMLQLKRFAPISTDHAVAPRLAAVELDAAWYLPRMKALYGGTMPGFVATPALEAGLLAAAPLVGRSRGIAALGAYLAQPFLVTTGGPINPRDLSPLGVLTRGVRDVVKPLAALQASTPAPVVARMEEEAAADEVRRADYGAALEEMPAFFEPARVTCPWCHDNDIHYLLHMPDLMQGKPGHFRLDECKACGHVFQNPRLSIEGLDFYYRDFYDGLGDEDSDFVFSMGSRSYRDRAEMLQGVAEPKRWLDVGAGHGHFCLLAQDMWPETRFDGLDLSDSVLEAQRRGWIERGHKGLFPDLANEMVGSYDVVSMHHYLEHTRDPGEELDAAHTTLQKGGHLLIEVPDPDSRLGRALGWMWGPWFQPQHQHFVSMANLTKGLEERGFTVVSTETGPAHQPIDLAFSLWLLANRVAPAGNKPWLPRPTLSRRIGLAVTWTVFAPLLMAALLADQAIAPILRRLPRMTNTYRVLARKN